MSREAIKATLWGLVLSLSLAGLVVFGSRNLSHFDAALVTYTFAILFATFGLTYRYVMWLQRPPTRTYWRQGWRAFFTSGSLGRRIGDFTTRIVGDVFGNRFIFRRNPLRGITHMLIMWGCIIACLITFPLVFGWLHFAPVPGDMESYRVMVFGFETLAFPVHAAFAHFIFHGLVWSAFLVIPGTMLAMRRRMIDRGAAAVQQLAEDIMPLFLLFAVSVTGLMLTASFTFMQGYAYTFIAILHAITVIATFLWLPFGKFFHVFQRPAQMGVAFYKDSARDQEKAHCRRCGHGFASKLHVEDLIKIQAELGFDYRIEPTGSEPTEEDAELDHFQWICPPCRRVSMALAQGKIWANQRGGRLLPRPITTTTPTPRYANPGLGSGPLGQEDAENFHP